MVTRNGKVVRDQIPPDAGEQFSNALIVSASMGTADEELAVLNSLTKKGIKPEDVVLVRSSMGLIGVCMTYQIELCRQQLSQVWAESTSLLKKIRRFKSWQPLWILK